MDAENLQELIFILVASKRNLFLFLSKLEPPYKKTSFLTLFDKDSKFSEVDFHYSQDQCIVGKKMEAQNLMLFIFNLQVARL